MVQMVFLFTQKKKKKKKILTYPLGFTVRPFYPQNVQLTFMIA